MYVRWKRRAMTRKGNPTGRTALTAVLAESRRVDGKPRQRVVSYLGTVVEEFAIYPWRQFGFWVSTEAQLAQLQLPVPEYERLRATIAAVVPRPDIETMKHQQEEVRAAREARNAQSSVLKSEPLANSEGTTAWARGAA